jgi:hypothetical protein
MARARRGAERRAGKGGRSMVLGMTLETFTRVHVIISLIAIASGLLTVSGMARGQRTDGWTGIFLLTTVLTSVTGFLFPFDHLLPSHQVGIVSLVVLAIVLLGRYGTTLSGAWRWIYPLGCVLALYLNVLVLVVQAFQKIAFLAALAPTQSELPFQLVQLAVLGLFLWLAVRAVRGFPG